VKRLCRVVHGGSQLLRDQHFLQSLNLLFELLQSCLQRRKMMLRGKMIRVTRWPRWPRWLLSVVCRHVPRRNFSSPSTSCPNHFIPARQKKRGFSHNFNFFSCGKKNSYASKGIIFWRVFGILKIVLWLAVFAKCCNGAGPRRGRGLMPSASIAGRERNPPLPSWTMM